MSNWIPSPALEFWLTQGGDSRIELNPQRLNAYGYPPHPLANWHGFSACTASAISPPAYEAARLLHERLPDPLPAAHCVAEWQRIRLNILHWNQLDDLTDLRLVFAASGSDAHRLAAWITRTEHTPTTVTVMADPAETGSLIAEILQQPTANNTERLITVPVREADTTLRSLAAVDGEFEQRLHTLAAQGHGLRLIVLDVSKTGLIVPSPACVLRIKKHHGPDLPIVVDASQLRLSARAIRAYVQSGCVVILTGSKYLGGPAFSGVVLIPGEMARKQQRHPLPVALQSISRSTEWPPEWTGADTLPAHSNRGLLLRFEAALHEWNGYRQLPRPSIATFMRHFNSELTEYISSRPELTLLETPNPVRTPLCISEEWDELPGILPFILRDRANTRCLTATETHTVYQDSHRRALTRSPIFTLGQPVLCGRTESGNISALRLALSAPLITRGIPQPQQLINEAIQGLDELLYHSLR